MSAYFLTLTYDVGNQPTVISEDGELIATIDKRHVQLFLKKLRKQNDAETPPSNPYELPDQIRPWPNIKYYFVGEYGTESGRPHYHAIIFNVKPETLGKIEAIWALGFTSIGNVQPASVHYCTKYVINSADRWEHVQKPFSLVSKKLGANYLSTNGMEHKKTLSTTVSTDRGKSSLPRYYKDKIFSIKEKQAIALASIESADIFYRDAIINETFHSDNPDRSLEEKIRYAYEKIKTNKHNPKSL